MPKPVGPNTKRNSATPNEVLGRAITELRTTAGLSQVFLAEALGYSTYYVGKIERGEANATCDVMAAVSNYFKMTIGQLWTYAEQLSSESGPTSRKEKRRAK